MKFILLILIKVHNVLSCPAPPGKLRLCETTTVNDATGKTETDATYVSIKHTTMSQPSIKMSETPSMTDRTDIITSSSKTGGIVLVTEDKGNTIPQI